jgi:hypothetical protein
VALLQVARAGAPRLRPCGPAEALSRLAPSTIVQLPDAGQSAMATLVSLVRRVPTYSLKLGPDLDAVVALVAELAGHRKAA